MIKFIYKVLQKIKEKSPLYPGTRNLEMRKYLTMTGLKDWSELTYKDKYQLCIEII